MSSKDLQSKGKSAEEKYRLISQDSDLIQKIKIKIREIKENDPNKAENKEKIALLTKIVVRHEAKQAELRKDLTNLEKKRLLRQQYELLFPDSHTTYRILSEGIANALDPTKMLREQFTTLKKLGEKISAQAATKDEIDQFYSLMEKVNQFLTVLNNLKINIPQPKKSIVMNAQRTLIQLPIYGAEVLSKIAITAKKEITKKFKNIENSFEEYIAFQGFSSVRKTLLSVPTFFTGYDEAIEHRVKTCETRELHEVYSQILLEPFKAVQELGLNPKIEENHPKKVLARLMHGEELSINKQDTDSQSINIKQRSETITKLENAIQKHEIIASLINMQFSYWRRFASLNLETIKSAIKRMSPDVLRAITFDETQIIPGFIDWNKLVEQTTNGDDLNQIRALEATISKQLLQGNDPSNLENINGILANLYKSVDSKALKKLDSTVLNSIINTFLYDRHDWQVLDYTLGSLLRKQGVTEAFTNYNRGLINSREKNVENATVPRTAIAILSHSEKPGRQFAVQLVEYGHKSDTSYQKFREGMLECWIDSKGDIERTKQLWKQKLQELIYFQPTSYPLDLIRNVIRAQKDSKNAHIIYSRDDIKKKIIAFKTNTGVDININHLDRLINYITSNQSKGEDEVLKWWNEKYCAENSHKTSFNTLLSEVYTLPCVVLPINVSESKNVNRLQQELTKVTNELRSQFVTASMILTYGINHTGDFALSISCDHANWDGEQSGAMTKKILTRQIATTKEIQANQDKTIKQKDHVDVSAITSSESDQNVLEQKGNHQIQSYVEAEGFLRICDTISKKVNTLMKNGVINPESKMKNPAVIMQLILIHHYRRLLSTKVDRNDKPLLAEAEEIGMLLGNKDITKDLDLAPIREGFDLELFNTLNSKQQEKYLSHFALMLELAFEHTNMTIIKRVGESIPFQAVQEFLNSVSRTRALIGAVADFAGKCMISAFPVPKIINGEIIIEKVDGVQIIRNSGPAQADFQQNSMTIVGALKMAEKFYLSICYKNNNNAIAIQLAKEFKKIIEKYDVNYYNDWLAKQNIPLQN